MKRVFKGLSVVLAVSMILCFAGCSRQIAVKVSDCGKSKQVALSTGSTVEEALIEAGYTLYDEDETVPARNEKLTKDVTKVTIKRYANVALITDDGKMTVALTGATVADVLKIKKITLGKDKYLDADVKPTDYLTDGMTITVLSMFKVTVKADGKKNTSFVKATTVEQALEELNITVGEDDKVSPKPDTKLDKEGTDIIVERVVLKTEMKTEEIPYKVIKKSTYALDEGVTKVQTAGMKGSKQVKYKVTFVDGKEAKRKAVSEEVKKEPIDEVILVGAKKDKKTAKPDSSSRKILSKEKVYYSDGSGHGYYIIKYKDGIVEYEDF